MLSKQLYLYNSLTKKKELITPRDLSTFKMYVCGPTVYDSIHIGNARPLVVFDLLYKVLKSKFAKVKYVRNLTDIDDKIINKAKEKNLSIKELTEITINNFHDDCKLLNIETPTYEPRATEVIPEIIYMIEKMIEKKVAYVAEGHVLFNIESNKTYGCLSCLEKDELISGNRIEIAPYKKNPGDFILWKPSTKEQPSWESPWSQGRPGWHIECSAMIYKYFGESFDLHGGGIDLSFPHHENEIAQSTSIFGAKSFAKYWAHNGLLTVEGSKMSKSQGNFIFLRDILKRYHPEIIKFTLLQTHYKKPLDWSIKNVNLAINTLNKIYSIFKNHQNILDNKVNINVDEEFLVALYDDLNTPMAISILHKLILEFKKNPNKEILLKIKSNCQLLGVLNTKYKDWFSTRNLDISESEIEKLIHKRNLARDNKDYVEADKIRDYLSKEKVLLQDFDKETIWYSK